MAVLLGTREGLYRADRVPFDRLDPVLADGTVTSLAVDDDVFAAMDGYLYRSSDGREFARLGVPADRVRTVAAGPDGTVYAGAHPSRLFLSRNGDDWTELDALQDLPSRSDWEKRGGQDAVSTVAVPQSVPDRIVVGVEPAGVHVSDDGGETFVERRYGLHDDVHHLAVAGPREFLAATGGGLYRTGDAGRTWARLDTDHTYFEYTYFHATTVHQGVTYAAAATGAPGSWDEAVDAALFGSRDGEEFVRIPLPVDGEFPVAFGTHDGRLLAGTLAHDLAVPGTDPAHVLFADADGRDVADDWAVAGEAPAGVTALAEL